VDPLNSSPSGEGAANHYSYGPKWSVEKVAILHEWHAAFANSLPHRIQRAKKEHSRVGVVTWSVFDASFTMGRDYLWYPLGLQDEFHAMYGTDSRGCPEDPMGNYVQEDIDEIMTGFDRGYSDWFCNL
jgi:hypothetical protein